MTSPMNMPKRRPDHAATVVPPARHSTEAPMPPEDTNLSDAEDDAYDRGKDAEWHANND